MLANHLMDDTDFDLEQSLITSRSIEASCVLTPGLQKLFDNQDFTDKLKDTLQRLCSGPDSILEKALAVQKRFLQDSIEPFVLQLESFNMVKHFETTNQTLFDVTSRLLWAHLPMDKLEELLAPAVAAAVQVGQRKVQKQMSCWSKLCPVICHVAVLQEWRDAGVGSVEATALKAESAGRVASLMKALERLQDFVDCTCASTQVADISHAVQLDDSKHIVAHCSVFDDVRWGTLVHRASLMGTAIKDEISSVWEKTLLDLAAQVKPDLVEWEDKGEALLQPEQQDLVKALLTNQGYANLTPLASAILAMATVARTHPGLLPKDSLDQAVLMAENAMKVVAVTYTLYHLKVAWPKVRGQKNQREEREKLVQQHKNSEFRNAWACLPEAIKKAVNAFGA